MKQHSGIIIKLLATSEQQTPWKSADMMLLRFQVDRCEQYKEDEFRVAEFT